MKKIISFSAVLLAGSAEAAQVDFGENVYINIGANSAVDAVFYPADTDSRTADFTELTWGGTANSLYDRTGGASATALDAGDKVWDVSAGAITTLTNQFPGTNTPAQSLTGSQLEGFGLGWNLSYDYILNGTTLSVSGGIPQSAFFSSGIMNVYFNSILPSEQGAFDGVKVLQLNVDSFSATFGSQVSIFINGVVDYSFVASLTAAQQAFVQNFFNFSLGDVAFYDLWLAGQPTVLPLTWRIDTNLTDNAAPLSSVAEALRTSTPDSSLAGVPATLYAGTPTTWQNVAAGDLLGRTTAITPSLRFERIPEPGSLLLLGVGLFSFAFNANRRAGKKAA